MLLTPAPNSSMSCGYWYIPGPNKGSMSLPWVLCLYGVPTWTLLVMLLNFFHLDPLSPDSALFWTPRQALQRRAALEKHCAKVVQESVKAGAAPKPDC